MNKKEIKLAVLNILKVLTNKGSILAPFSYLNRMPHTRHNKEKVDYHE